MSKTDKQSQDDIVLDLNFDLDKELNELYLQQEAENKDEQINKIKEEIKKWNDDNLKQIDSFLSEEKINFENFENTIAAQIKEKNCLIKSNNLNCLNASKTIIDDETKIVSDKLQVLNSLVNNLKENFFNIKNIGHEEEQEKLRIQNLEEDLLKKFESEFKLFSFTRKEIIDTIRQEKYEEKNLRDFIEKKKNKLENDLFEQLEKEFKLTSLSIKEEEIKNIIKKENYDKKKLREWAENLAIQNKKKVENSLFLQLKNENKELFSFISEEEIRKKITETSDYKKLREWAEELTKEHKEKLKDELFSKLVNDYKSFSSIKEEDLKKKIFDDNLDEKEIRNWADGLANEEKKSLEEQLFNKLVKDYDLLKFFDEVYIREEIRKNSFTESILIEWADKSTKAIIEEEKGILEQLEKEFSLSKYITEEEIGEKIRKEKRDLNKLKEWANNISKFDSNESGTKKIIETLDSEYNILSLMPENEIRKKIKEYRGDLEKIKSWIENDLENY